MNRFKKELRKRGFKLENDYDYLPYEVEYYMVLDSVVVDTEHCTFTEHYNSITIQLTFDRAMNAHDALEHSCATCLHGPFPCTDDACPGYTPDNPYAYHYACDGIVEPE